MGGRILTHYSLASGEERAKVYSSQGGQTLLVFQNRVSPRSSPTAAPPARGLTAVALPIPDVTPYQVLHPQLGAHTALRDGVTVTVARALQKAACKEAGAAEASMAAGEGRAWLLPAVDFHEQGPDRHILLSQEPLRVWRGCRGSLIRKQTAENSQSISGNKSLKNVANT